MGIDLKALVFIQTMVFILKLLFVSAIESSVHQRYEKGSDFWRRKARKSGLWRKGMKEKESEGDGFRFCFFLTA